MKRILLKVLLGLSPVILLLTVYVVKDPFKVLHRYDSYFPSDGIQYVTLNNDFTTVQTYLQNYKKYSYDSYVFGNSKGLLFHMDKWSKYIPGARCFQFSSSNEGLFGVERKLRLIDSVGGEIKNVLLIFDDPLYKQDRELPNFPKHPLISDKSMLTFQVNNLKAFFEKDFLVPYLKLLVTHRVKESIFSSELNTKRTVFDPVTNDLSYPDLEPLINSDTANYYKVRKSVFYERHGQKIAPKYLTASHVALLKSIRQILDKHHTSYNVVITPQYSQLTPDPEDLKLLHGILGKENFYDFSGKNDITDDIYNYYENVHFRTFIADRIMDSIYKK